MRFYKFFIFFIILIKIIFILLSIIHLYVSRTHTSPKLLSITEYWRNRCEFIFTISMAILLIYLFYPYHKVTLILDKESRFLLYMFGFLLLITANWTQFFSQAKWIIPLQNVISK